jgi:hypothetical protein
MRSLKSGSWSFGLGFRVWLMVMDGVMCLAVSSGVSGSEGSAPCLSIEAVRTPTDTQVRVTSQASQRLILEATTDLVEWQPVWTNAVAGTPLVFTEEQPGVYPARFYREVLQPTSLVLVRRSAAGGVVLRSVAGEQMSSEGTTPWLDLPVALPNQVQPDPAQLSAPSAVVFPSTDRLYVARAVVNPVAHQSTIYLVDSRYATMLSETSARVAVERLGIIDSAVVLTHFRDQLLLVWREGSRSLRRRASVVGCDRADESIGRCVCLLE